MRPYQQVAIVGVGLLGGSIAKALKSRNLALTVVGIGRSQERLEKAINAGIIDKGFTDGTRGLEGTELVIVCTPVDQAADRIVEAASVAAQTAWITDVSSTKSEIVAAVETALPDAPFIGSHPLAGDHRSGPEFSQADLYVGRTVVITPTQRTAAGLVERATEFWESLGSRVELMSPEEHDHSVAHTSHLPHLVATALALATPEACGRLVASGWLDTTRVAAGEAALWRPIFTTNRTEVIEAVARFRAQLDRLADALDRNEGDALEQLLVEGKRIRDALGN
jgi:prephenate dehydrogenase